MIGNTTQVYDNLTTTTVYYKYDNFKQKPAASIVSLLNQSRTSKVLSFLGYGTVSFNDNDIQIVHPIVTMLDDFTRGKTNVMVFDINRDYEYCHYDKLFIFNNILTHKEKGIEGSYMALFYDSLSGNTLTKSPITLDQESLIHTIQSVVLRMEKLEF